MGLFDFLRRKKVPNTIEDAMASQAQDFVSAFTGTNSPVDTTRLDYSESSLELIDQILQDFFLQAAPLPEDLHFMASAYVFETIRMQFGGRYLRYDEDNPFVLVIGEPEFQLAVCVMEKIKKRALNGPEDSILFFYEGIAPLVKNATDTILI